MKIAEATICPRWLPESQSEAEAEAEAETGADTACESSAHLFMEGSSQELLRQQTIEPSRANCSIWAAHDTGHKTAFGKRKLECTSKERARESKHRQQCSTPKGQDAKEPTVNTTSGHDELHRYPRIRPPSRQK
jgi:hypothetical protein